MINKGGASITFAAIPNYTVSGVIWYFGDAQTGYGNIVEHTYNELTSEYQVCVAAWYWNEATQDSCWAEACQWVVPLTVGIADERSFTGGIQVYPVPASDHLIVEGTYGPGNNATIELYTIDGRLVRRDPVSEWPCRIQTGALAPGVHVLRSVDADRVHQFRFIKE